MMRKTINSIPLWFFENVSKYPNVIHFVSSRQGGVSKATYGSLNIGFNTDDEFEHVKENRLRLARAVGIRANNFVTAKQVHGDNVAYVTKEDRGKGALDYESAIGSTDAMITKEENICLLARVADCAPLLFFDPRGGAIGLAHAGWRGSVNEIAKKTVEAMAHTFDSKPDTILVGIGPSIGPCCYEVGREVIDAQKALKIPRKENILLRKDKQMILNLWELNKQQSLMAGILEKNIEIAGICTKDHSDVFFSSRALGAATGRFAAGIMLTPKG